MEAVRDKLNYEEESPNWKLDLLRQVPSEVYFHIEEIGVHESMSLSINSNSSTGVSSQRHILLMTGKRPLEEG